MMLLESLRPVILVLHILICIFLIVVILLQAGKGAEAGASFGMGGSQSLFGARGAATLLSKVTTVVALLFLVTSISLATIHQNRLEEQGEEKSAVDKALEVATPIPPPAPSEVPAADVK